MSVIIQSSPDSLRAVGDCNPTISVEVPPALITGDMLVVLVTIVDENVEPEILNVRDGWQVARITPARGSVSLFYRPIVTREQVQELIAERVLEIRLSATHHICANAFAFRVTGADPVRFIEAVHPSVGSMQETGHLTIPSLDPEYRRDNAVLYSSTLSYPITAPTPYSVVSGAAPVSTISHIPGPDDDMDALVTSIYSRTLSSADPIGESQVSATLEPLIAFAGAFMIRSANRPPVVTLPETWAAEIGRQVSVRATVADADQTPISYAWSQTSGPEQVQISNVYSPAFTLTPSMPGIYMFSLSATDVDGGRATVHTRVVVPTGRAAPSAIIKAGGWTDQDGETLTSPGVLGDGSDATFARTTDLPVGEPLILGLPPIYGGSAVTLMIRGAATNPSPALVRMVTLTQSDGTVIAERTYLLSTDMRSYVFTTTRNETAMITNRSDMSVTIVDEVA